MSNDNDDNAAVKQAAPLWVRKLLTLVLMAGAATGVVIGVDALTDGWRVPIWVALVATVVFIAAYRGATRLAKKITSWCGFVLDAAVGIPLGVFFYAFQRAFPVREGFSGTLTTIVFVFIAAWNISGYFYTRYPRQHT